MTAPADGLSWFREEAPVWDADKARVIGGAPEGTFVLGFDDGQELPGDWWAARSTEDEVVGYGRLGTTWGGDAEILLAVAPDRQEAGVGSFILARLDEEAAARGLNYVHNRQREHERRDLVHHWLVVRGFRGTIDGDLRRRVGLDRQSAPAPHPAGEAYDAAQHPADQAPGHEEQGGYVDVEEHQY